eukprot:349911-Chlamydomonas_euryale.AAC.2
MVALRECLRDECGVARGEAGGCVGCGVWDVCWGVRYWHIWRGPVSSTLCVRLNHVLVNEKLRETGCGVDIGKGGGQLNQSGHNGGRLSCRAGVHAVSSSSVT